MAKHNLSQNHPTPQQPIPTYAVLPLAPDPKPAPKRNRFLTWLLALLGGAK